MGPPTTGREPRPPSHVSAAATCHTLPGLGSVMERSLSVGEGANKRTQQGRGNSGVPSTLGPDLKVWSGSLKKGMHCPAPKRPEPRRAGHPSPRLGSSSLEKERAGSWAGKVLKNLLIHSSSRSISGFGRCLLSPKTTDGAGADGLVMCGLRSVCLHRANESGGV